MDDIEIISYFHPMGLVNPSSARYGMCIFHLKTTNHRSHIPPRDLVNKSHPKWDGSSHQVSGVSAKCMETRTNTLREQQRSPRASLHPQMKGRVCRTILRNTHKTTTAWNTIIIIILIGFPFWGRDHEELTNKMVNLWEAKWCGKKSL